MANGSGVTLVFDTASVPILPGALAVADENQSRGLATNRQQFAPMTDDGGITGAALDVLFDPQTSGGLLVALDPATAPAILAALQAADVPAVAVGHVTARGIHAVRLT